MKKLKRIIYRIRNKLVMLIVGDMPVVLNMNISRPEGFNYVTSDKAQGNLIYVPKPDLPHLIQNNVFLSTERKNLLSPTRDVDEIRKAHD